MNDVREGTTEELEELAPDLLQPAPSDAKAPPPVFERVHFRGQVARPLLGPALSIFGAWLWAYGVLGELVLRQEFPEALGFLGLLASIGVAWYFAIQRSFEVDAPSVTTQTRRFALPFLLAGALFLGAVAFATLLGSLGSWKLDPLITVLLWLAGLVAILRGRALTDPDRIARGDSARRALGILLWTGASMVTLVALLSLFS